jgi:hypothetical protein
MASIAGHYRGPLDAQDAREIAAHLREGGAPADVLLDKRLKESADPREAGGPVDDRPAP